MLFAALMSAASQDAMVFICGFGAMRVLFGKPALFVLCCGRPLAQCAVLAGAMRVIRRTVAGSAAAKGVLFL